MMRETRIGRRNLLKVGSLGAVASLLGSCEKNPQRSARKVKGIVFMVADGMSHGVLTMAENFSRIVHGTGTRWWELINDPKSTRAASWKQAPPIPMSPIRPQHLPLGAVA